MYKKNESLEFAALEPVRAVVHCSVHISGLSKSPVETDTLSAWEISTRGEISTQGEISTGVDLYAVTHTHAHQLYNVKLQIKCDGDGVS